MTNALYHLNDREYPDSLGITMVKSAKEEEVFFVLIAVVDTVMNLIALPWQSICWTELLTRIHRQNCSNQKKWIFCRCLFSSDKETCSTEIIASLTVNICDTTQI